MIATGCLCYKGLSEVAGKPNLRMIDPVLAIVPS